jgi:hypothetical protein
MIDIDLTGVWHTAKAAIPQTREQVTYTGASAPRASARKKRPAQCLKSAE